MASICVDNKVCVVEQPLLQEVLRLLASKDELNELWCLEMLSFRSWSLQTPRHVPRTDLPQSPRKPVVKTSRFFR